MPKPRRKLILIHVIGVLAVILLCFQICVYDYPSHAHQWQMEALVESIYHHCISAEFARNNNGQVEYFQVPAESAYNTGFSGTLPYTTPSKRTFDEEKEWLYRLSYTTEDGIIVFMIDEFGLMNVNGVYVVMADEHWLDVLHNIELTYADARKQCAVEILTCPLDDYS